jgi:hypothetical protein
MDHFSSYPSDAAITSEVIDQLSSNTSKDATKIKNGYHIGTIKTPPQ